mgnify:CR=1 FL=1
MNNTKISRRSFLAAASIAGAAAALTACGSSASTDSVAASSEAASTESTAASSEAAESTAETSELAGTTLKVAASPTPHAEILNVAKEVLAEQGIDLEVVEFSDYVQPNLVTESGEVDANYFQHTPYLDSFNEENGTHLVSVGAVHYEPFGIYPGKSDDLANIADGATIAVPNDTTNEARALTLLEKNGFFKLKADAGLTATKNDIEENPLNVTVDEVEAAQVPNVLQDEDYAVINSNYAISAGLDPMTDALAMEDGSSAYVNVLVCKEGNENEPKIKALVAALQSQQVKDFMDENYKGAVVSVVENPTDGYDSSIDYDALNGETVSCAATPAPHCEVLEVCKDILAAKGITLDIQEYDDYVIPNTIVEDGQCDTNYFQHQPYLDNFNEEKGTHLVTVAGIHVEPMGIYGGKQDSLAPIEG